MSRTFDLAAIRVISMIAVLLCASCTWADEGKSPEEKKYRRMLGPDSEKVKIEEGKTWLWAGGATSGPEAQWYAFTGSPIPAAELQYGIGKDVIESIDDPLFVASDDPRLAGLDPSPYRKEEEKPKTNDDMQVIGVVIGDHARAYPVSLLDHHELVNDTFGSKHIGVGW